MYGSLYYAKDLHSPSPNQFLNAIDSKDECYAFAVGPTTNRAFFDQGRDAVEVNRGPCKRNSLILHAPLRLINLIGSSPSELVHSRAERELACIEKYSSFPSPQGLFGGPNQYRPTKELKIEVLQNYLKVATCILPNDVNLSKPTLWHADLHTNNIFVDPAHPTTIVNIIDWQAVNISPLFLQARHPSLIDFEGPVPEGFEPPTLPEDFDSMSADQQQQAKNLRAAQSLYKLYEILMLRQCPEITCALRFRDTLPGQITGLANSIFSNGEPVLQRMLIRLQHEWATCIGSTIACPLAFTSEEAIQQQRLEGSWNHGVELMHEVLTETGAYQGWDGWVNHNNYSMYQERLVRCRENFINRHAVRTAEERSQWMQAWLFQDRGHELSSP